MDEWDVLHNRLWEEMKPIRGKLVEDVEHEAEIEQRLKDPPAGHCGLGLLSHRACAPHSYPAVVESADELVDAHFVMSGLDGKESGKSQKERFRVMWENDVDELVGELGDVSERSW